MHIVSVLLTCRDKMPPENAMLLDTLLYNRRPQSSLGVLMQ